MDLLALVARLSLDKSEYEQGLKDAESDISSTGERFGSIIGGVAKTAGSILKIGAAGIAAGSAAVVALSKQSTSAYASYEQLSGGIKKLFGTAGLSLEEYAAQQGQTVDEASEKFAQLTEAQNLVAQNAAKAYETAGMSANAYMENVSGFSAALVNSLGGDTVEAAKRADVAMTAISDNVNTFGSDVQSVQYAFQGFAKQNYTMLDNLKLGYGGTKTEMERLIADANEYAKANGQAADLSIDSFADIVTAIDLIQQKQNIADTTAREAATTVEGSLNMVKGAWTNLLAGLANPDVDIGSLVDDLVKSAETAFGNLLPVVKRSIEGIGTFIADVTPELIEKIPGVIEETLPSIISAGSELINGLILTLSNTIPNIINTIPEVINSMLPTLQTSFMGIGTTLISTLNTLLPSLSNVGVQFINNIAQGLKTGVPQFLSQALPMMVKFSETLRAGAGQMVDAGIDLILNLGQGIADSLPALIENIPDIVINIAGIINDNAPKLLFAGIQLIITLGRGIIQAIPTLIENIPKIFHAIIAVWSALNWVNMGKQLVKFIANGVKNLSSQIPSALKSIGQKAINFFKGVPWGAGGKAVIQFILNAIRGMITAIPTLLGQIARSAMSAFTSIDWASVGTNIIKGVVSGITSGIGWIKDAAINAAKSALNAAKDILGISSPSKVFRKEVGLMIGQGMALGIDDSNRIVDRSMQRLNTDLLTGFDSLEIPTVSTMAGEAPEGGKAINITNYITVNGADSPEDLATRLVRQMELEVRMA